MSHSTALLIKTLNAFFLETSLFAVYLFPFKTFKLSRICFRKLNETFFSFGTNLREIIIILLNFDLLNLFGKCKIVGSQTSNSCPFVTFWVCHPVNLIYFKNLFEDCCRWLLRTLSLKPIYVHAVRNYVLCTEVLIKISIFAYYNIHTLIRKCYKFNSENKYFYLIL